MTNALHDGDFDLRPEDAPDEWLAFKREARYRARVRNGHSASIELFPTLAGGPCDGLFVDLEDDCDDEAVAAVTDEHEIEGRRQLCEVHFSMYLSGVLPAIHNWEQAYKRAL